MPSSTLTIDERALTTIAKAAVLSVGGTTSVSKVAGRNLPRVDVRLDSERQSANVEAFIAATWPSPLTHLTEVVRQAITEWLDTYAGVEALRVNVVISELVHGRRIDEAVASTPPQLFSPEAPKREAIEPVVRRSVDTPAEPQVRHTLTEVREPSVRQRVKEARAPKVRRGVREAIKPQVRQERTARVIEPQVNPVNTSKAFEPRVDARHTSKVIEPKIHSDFEQLPTPSIEDYRVQQHDLKPVVAPGVPEVKIETRPVQVREVRAPRAMELAPIHVIPVDPKRGFANRNQEGTRHG